MSDNSAVLVLLIMFFIAVGVASAVGLFVKYSKKRETDAAIQKGKGPPVLVEEYRTSQEFQRDANRLAELGYQVQTTSGKKPMSVTYVKRTIKPSREEPSPSKQAPPLLADEIRKLADLKSLSILTEEEFQRAKELFLGKPADKREEALMILKNLHSLYKAGVLSESEFNMKKWDILSRKV